MSIQDQIPRSRINLRYRTSIKKEGELLELPFRLLILGDLSLGSAVDREVDLDSRRMRSLDGTNLDAVMTNMRMSMHFKLENLIDPQSEEELDIDIPVQNRKSFLPDHVAANVPKIRALLLLRKLLLEMQSNIDNRKELRRIIHDIFSKPEALETLKKELAAYAQYQLPAHQALATKPAKPAEQQP